jgi:hypothetical protein
MMGRLADEYSNDLAVQRAAVRTSSSPIPNSSATISASSPALSIPATSATRTPDASKIGWPNDRRTSTITFDGSQCRSSRTSGAPCESRWM